MFFPFEKLQTLFKYWLNLYPHTHFHFLFESLGGACERLVTHQADLVITEDLITHQAIEVHVLHSEPMIAVASPDFIEAHQTQLSSLDTLNACMQVILRDSSKSDFSFGVVSHCRHWTVRDVRAKKEIILAGLGWGRLPLFLIQSELDSGLLARLQGHHFDARLLTFSAIRLQKSNYGTIATQIWEDLGSNIERLKAGS